MDIHIEKMFGASHFLQVLKFALFIFSFELKINIITVVTVKFERKFRQMFSRMKESISVNVIFVWEKL